MTMIRTLFVLLLVVAALSAQTTLPEEQLRTRISPLLRMMAEVDAAMAVQDARLEAMSTTVDQLTTQVTDASARVDELETALSDLRDLALIPLVKVYSPIAQTASFVVPGALGLRVVRNGVELTIGEDYTLSGLVVTFLEFTDSAGTKFGIPQPGDLLKFWYYGAASGATALATPFKVDGQEVRFLAALGEQGDPTAGTAFVAVDGRFIRQVGPVTNPLPDCEGCPSHFMLTTGY